MINPPEQAQSKPKDNPLLKFMNQKTLKVQRNLLLEQFQDIVKNNKKIKISQLKLDEIISDIKNGQIPDFGLPEYINFDDLRPGWHLLASIIYPYPKYQKLADFIEQQNDKKQEQLKKQFKLKMLMKGKLQSSQGLQKLKSSIDLTNIPSSSTPQVSNYQINQVKLSVPIQSSKQAIQPKSIMKSSKQIIQTLNPDSSKDVSNQFLSTQKREDIIQCINEKYAKMKEDAQKLENEIRAHSTDLERIKINHYDPVKFRYLSKKSYLKKMDKPIGSQNENIEAQQLQVQSSSTTQDQNRLNLLAINIDKSWVQSGARSISQKQTTKKQLSKNRVKFAESILADLNPEQKGMLEAFKSYLDLHYKEKQQEGINKEISKLKLVMSKHKITAQMIESYIEECNTAKTPNSTSSYKTFFKGGSSPKSQLSNLDKSPKSFQKSLFNNKNKKQYNMLSPSFVQFQHNVDIHENDSFNDSNTQHSVSLANYSLHDNEKQVEYKKESKPKEHYKFIKDYPKKQNLNQSNVKLVVSQLINKIKKLRNKLQIQIESFTQINDIKPVKKLKKKEIILSQLQKLYKAKNFIIDEKLEQLVQKYELTYLTDQIDLINQLYPKDEIIIQEKSDDQQITQKKIVPKIKDIRSKTPLLQSLKQQQQYKSHSFQRETYLQQLERKLNILQDSQIPNLKQNQVHNQFELNTSYQETIQRNQGRVQVKASTQLNSPKEEKAQNQIRTFDNLAVHLRHTPLMGNKSSLIDRLKPQRLQSNNMNTEAKLHSIQEIQMNRSQRSNRSFNNQNFDHSLNESNIESSNCKKSEKLPEILMNNIKVIDDKISKNSSSIRYRMNSSSMSTQSNSTIKKVTSYNLDFLQKVMETMTFDNDNNFKRQINNINFQRDSQTAVSSIRKRNNFNGSFKQSKFGINDYI
eukprot:403361293